MHGSLAGCRHLAIAESGGRAFNPVSTVTASHATWERYGTSFAGCRQAASRTSKIGFCEGALIQLIAVCFYLLYLLLVLILIFEFVFIVRWLVLVA